MLLIACFFSPLSLIVIVNICQDRGKWQNSHKVEIIFFEFDSDFFLELDSFSSWIQG